MRLAVIADIHSNLEALDCVLGQIDQEGVDAILNLGDLVGYNASPNECLELLQSRNVWSLAGNHDLALFDPERAQHFNIIAYQALMWCREQVRPEFLEYLQGLPLLKEQPGVFLACHGTPGSPDTYIAYHFQGKRVLKHLLHQPKLRVCFFGHTHRRALWYRDIRGTVAVRRISPDKMRLSLNEHYLINPGSVGQPRDGNPEAAYAIFDDQEFSIQFKSAPYDIRGAQRRILAAGLPPFLAERLAQGA
ncbi:MAG: metallophosphatase family protein [Syntrophobacterales bacterium]|jgi:diadenosine tetraphosphatase ApaH/serine/threonine PP2A family protein phosphatase|nr:metallophosphatase family protein [Syntrophobacterales bacterium]